MHSCHQGSIISDKSGSDGDSWEEKPENELTLLEVMERRAATNTVIDILRDGEDFKVPLNLT